MIEYVTYLIMVIGAFVLRFRLDARDSRSTLASYPTSTVNFLTFRCISPVIVGRSAAEYPLNIVAIVAIVGGGSFISFDMEAKNHTGARRVGPRVLEVLFNTQRSHTWRSVAEQ